MKKKRELKRLLLASLIPILALAVVSLLLPYLIISRSTISVTIYIFISIVAFFVLLRARNYWPLEPTKIFDKMVTIIVWAIAAPVIFISGTTFFLIVRIRKKSLYIAIYELAIIMTYLFGMRLKFFGEEIPECQFICTYNHCSSGDDIINPLIMGTKKWKVVFSPEIVRIPFVGVFLKFMGIPITRKEMNSRISAMKKLINESKAKFNILIFVEGNRLIVVPEKEKEDQPILLDFKDGAFALSKITGIPISPVVISWMFLYQPRKQWWFSPQTIEIHRLKLMQIEEGEDLQDFKKRVRDNMHEVLKKSIESKKK